MARLFAKECNDVVLSFALLSDINDLLMTMLILSSYELCAFKADVEDQDLYFRAPNVQA